MSEVPYFQRPPFGFIVEGTGEYLAYPSIVARIVKESGFNIPRVNAGGFAQVVHHLEEHLSDIVATYKPLSILITVDLIDVLYNKTARDCSELISILHGRIGAWSRANEHVVKFQPFPEQISVVIQIQKFEPWIIADKFGLRDGGFINLPEGECDWGGYPDEVGHLV